MNELKIKLSGRVESSNFNEWNNELIDSIQNINTNLQTDQEFSNATEDVKFFKRAEKLLKEAKIIAIEQSSDIQKLFMSIDKITEKARQTRLLLERQIKKRKIEIKEEYIQSGIENIKDFLLSRDKIMEIIDSSHYINRKIFEEAIKGKAGVKGLKYGINNLCDKLKNDICEEELILKERKNSIESLPENHRLLFQDLSNLLVLTKKEYQLTVEKRVALFNENKSIEEAKKANSNLRLIEDEELNTDQYGIDTTPENKNYKLIIDIFSSKEEAIKLAQMIKAEYSKNDTIHNIRLTKNYDI